MSVPHGWDATAAAGACSIIEWEGSVWRGHNRRYEATDHSGSLRSTGRYHRGPDIFPNGPNWPALYLCLSRDTCIAEINRQLTPATLLGLRNYRFTELRVKLQAVLEGRDLAPLNLALEHLCDDSDWEVPQLLAAAARARGAESMLVSSATGLGDNLILFPDRRRPGSTIEVAGFVDPRLLRG